MAACTAFRAAPSAICARQLVPSATMRVSAAAPRTVGRRGELAHRHRRLEVLLVVPEGARHAAAARLDRLDLDARDALKHLERGAGAPERLLVTVAVDEESRAVRRGGPAVSFAGEGQRAPGVPLLDEELLEHAGLIGDGGGLRTGQGAAGISSRRVYRHDGSRPTIRVPERARGRSTASRRSASARASSSMPALRYVRPQQSGRSPSAAATGFTAHPPAARSFDAARAFSGSNQREKVSTKKRDRGAGRGLSPRPLPDRPPPRASFPGGARRRARDVDSSTAGAVPSRYRARASRRLRVRR